MVSRTSALEEECWYAQDTLLVGMLDMIGLIYQCSLSTLLNNTNRKLVLDNELIPSRANDVECKTISSQKEGKEEPVSGCIACSLTS